MASRTKTADGTTPMAAAIAAQAEAPRPVIVRTYSAGVHFGYLVWRDGKEVALERSRRIWRWYGAETLSDIAARGLDIMKSRVASPVTIILTEAIEIIDCTPAGAASVEAATWVK